MGTTFLMPLRMAQGFTALAVLGLSSYVSHWYNADTLTASPSQFNFLIFLGTWTCLVLLYLEIVPRKWPRGSHPYAHFILETLTTIFHLSGFIALAVFLSKLLFCRGTVCSAARADVGFATLGFVLWVCSTAVLSAQIFKSGFRGVAAQQVLKEEMGRAGGGGVGVGLRGRGKGERGWLCVYD